MWFKQGWHQYYAKMEKKKLKSPESFIKNYKQLKNYASQRNKLPEKNIPIVYPLQTGQN